MTGRDVKILDRSQVIEELRSGINSQLFSDPRDLPRTLPMIRNERVLTGKRMMQGVVRREIAVVDSLFETHRDLLTKIEVKI